MKKGFKSFLIAILMFTLTLGISGCFWNETLRIYSKHGVSITLPEEFEEEKNLYATYLLTTNEVLVLFIQYEFEDYTEGYTEDRPLKEVANEYAEDRTSIVGTETSTRENKGYEYFELEEEIDEDDYYHYIAIYKSKDSFWILQFTCFKEDKTTYKKKFPKWADTVVFAADIEETSTEENI